MANKSKVMSADTLVKLVSQLADAAKGTPYTDKRGRAAVNNGLWVNTVYPRGAALNDILRGQGYDPIESVQAAIKAGKLVSRPAGGHSIAVGLPATVQSGPVKVTDIGAKNAAVAASFFKPAKPQAPKPVRETTMPWGKDTPPVEPAKGGIVSDTGMKVGK